MTAIFFLSHKKNVLLHPGKSTRQPMGTIAKQSIKGALANYIGVLIGAFTTFFVVTDLLTPEEIGLTRVMVDERGYLYTLLKGSNEGLMIISNDPTNSRVIVNLLVGK